MSRQLEQAWEERKKKRNDLIVCAVEFALVAAVERSGAILTGFSVRMTPTDTLLTLRVELAGRDQIAFVGGDDLGSCLIKAVRDGHTDKLNYRASKF